MDAFKDALQKLERDRDGGLIAPEEFESRRKKLVESYIHSGQPEFAQQGVTVPSGPGTPMPVFIFFPFSSVILTYTFFNSHDPQQSSPPHFSLLFVFWVFVSLIFLSNLCVLLVTCVCYTPISNYSTNNEHSLARSPTPPPNTTNRLIDFMPLPIPPKRHPPPK